MQFVVINLCGVLIGIMILSGYSLGDFIKPIYLIWLLIVLVAYPMILTYGYEDYPYKGQLITGLINIALYGVITIAVVRKNIIEKKFSKVRWSVFTAWIVMIGLMLASKNERVWPLWFGAMFGAFYLTDFGKEKTELIFKSIPDGVILGFFMIQGHAFLFRPYDVTPRYIGMYVNPNMNSIMYLMAYCGFLAKLFVIKKEHRNKALSVVVMLLSGAMYGFVILTGCRIALISMICVTVPFLICYLGISKKKLLTFVRYTFSMIVIAIVSIPITFLAARYIPTIHLHPIYFDFQDEYGPWRVLPGDSRDSEKYITFNQMLETDVGRILWFWGDGKESKLDKIIPVMQAFAEDLTDSETKEEEYIFEYEEQYSVGAVETRYVIHKYYFNRLNLLGHTTDEDGVPYSVTYTAPHAHNWILQLTFWFGIPVGVLLIVMCVLYVIRFFNFIKIGNDIYACIMGCFVTAFIVFGMLENDWRLGQLPFTLFFLLYYLVVNKGPGELLEDKKQD